MKKNILMVLIAMMLVAFLGCSQNKDSFAEVMTVDTTLEQKSSEVAEILQDKKFDTLDFEKLSNTVKEDKDTVTFIDALGDEITLNKNPQKVMVLYNSYADLWYHSGGDTVARLESNESLPEAFSDREVVGNNTSLNIEKIISMQPDLVILRAATYKDEMNFLKQSGIQCLAAEYNGFEQYLYTLKIFTALTGREDLYKQNGTDLLDKINSILEKVSKEEGPNVLLLLASSKSVSVRLSNTSTGQILEHLGAKNIAMDSALSESDREIFSMERVIQKNPDFIFVQAMGEVSKVEERLKADLESNPAWSSLDAVKNKHYIVLDKELYHFKANTRYAQAYEKLAKLLYTDLFQ